MFNQERIKRTSSEGNLSHCTIKANDNRNYQKQTDETTFTERSHYVDMTSITERFQHILPNTQPKPKQQFQSLGQCHCLQRKNQKIKISNLKSEVKSLNKLGIVFQVISKHFPSFYSKLSKHLSKLSTGDKYIRLIYSILKIYRAINAKNKLSLISKQLLNARRVIQWQQKYSLIDSFRSQQLSVFQVAYSTFQLTGNLFDFSSFWLQMLQKQSAQFKEVSQMLYSWSDDCYFYQCIIQLTLSIISLTKFWKQYRKVSGEIRVIKNQNERKIKICTKLKQTSMNQSRILYSEQQNSSGQTQGQCQLIMLQKQLRQQKKLITKNLVKVAKYIIDSTTAHNNYSKKLMTLDPLSGGILSTVSSLFSMWLIWCD